MDAGYGIIIALLVVAGAMILSIVRADFAMERAYGLLALALLVVVGLGYLWPTIFAKDANCGLGLDDSFDFTALVDTAFSVLLIALLAITGLVEMAITRRWRWLAGLLAASALMFVISLPSLPGFGHLPGLGETSCLFGGPNELIRRDAYWLVSEAVAFLVCAGYGVRATWFRSWPAA